MGSFNSFKNKIHFWLCHSKFFTSAQADLESLNVQNLTQQILNSMGEGIHGVDLSGTIVFENRAANEMLGFESDENLGKNSHLLMHHHYLDGQVYHRKDCPLFKTLQDGIPRRIDNETFWRKNGQPVFVDISSNPIFNKKGQLIGGVLSFRDLTEKKKSEEKMKENNSLISMAGRLAKIGGWTIDLDLNRVKYSKEVARIYEMPEDWSPDSVENAISFCEPEHQAELTRVYTACKQEGTPIDTEFQIVNGQWRKVWVRIIGEAVRNSAGRICQIQGALQDIEDRKKLEQHLLRSQRLESLGTLAGGIAHDLNNVLAPAMLATDILKTIDSDPRHQKPLATIQASISRGADLVKQVLSFARGYEGQRKVIHLPMVLQEIEKIANETFLKNIEVNLTWTPHLWPVLGDPTQLHQILLNISLNARDAMPQGGSLVISAKNIEIDRDNSLGSELTPGPYVVVSIKDTGTGIPTDVIDRIFDPFFTTKEVGKGTGLGLSTSLGIAKRHGGFIKVETKLGEGTTFSVYIPAQLEAEKIEPKMKPVLFTQGKGQTILVIDDEVNIREMIKDVLEPVGYHVLLASNGQEALTEIQNSKNKISLLVTDIMMPTLDGLKFIQTIRGSDLKIKILAISGLQTDENIQKASAAGANAFLAKPFAIENLIQKIDETLNTLDPLEPPLEL